LIRLDKQAVAGAAQGRFDMFATLVVMTAICAFSPLPLECRTTGMSPLLPFPKRSSSATMARITRSETASGARTYRFARRVVNAKFSRLYWQNQKSVL
jgi:hypothetical protein